MLNANDIYFFYDLPVLIHYVEDKIKFDLQVHLYQ